MKFYTVRTKDGKYPEICVSSNPDDGDCNDVEVSLFFCENPSNLWMTNKKENAEKVVNKSNTWYNADLDYPSYNEHFVFLEIVELEINI